MELNILSPVLVEISLNLRDNHAEYLEEGRSVMGNMLGVWV